MIVTSNVFLVTLSWARCHCPPQDRIYYTECLLSCSGSFFHVSVIFFWVILVSVASLCSLTSLNLFFIVILLFSSPSKLFHFLSRSAALSKELPALFFLLGPFYLVFLLVIQSLVSSTWPLDVSSLLTITLPLGLGHNWAGWCGQCIWLCCILFLWIVSVLVYGFM